MRASRPLVYLYRTFSFIISSKTLEDSLIVYTLTKIIAFYKIVFQIIKNTNLNH